MRVFRHRTAILAAILGLLICQATAAPSSNKTKVAAPAVEALTDESQDVIEDLCKSKESEIDCDQTEYTKYMDCIEEKKTIRRKRQTQCSTPANVDTVPAQDPMALTQCEFNLKMCKAGCKNDQDCENGCPTDCESLAVVGLPCLGEYNSCVSNCVPGQPCETKCKSLCPGGGSSGSESGAVRPLGYKTVIFEGHNDGPAEKVQVPIGIGHNITTIIRLNNYINNTNTINVPTTLNNTNLNTIHLYMNTSSISTEEGGRFGLGESKDGSCCFAVQPKTCRTSTSGLRCHHRRHKTCGDQCTARIIHVQNKKRCSRNGRKCSVSTSYVGEPNPKCHYKAQWPYVNCGGGGGGRRNCDGCYDHYSTNSYYDSQIPERCMSCYDGGYDAGPRYRQGPFYRPNYYHQPPCYVTGTCYNAGPQYDYGYYAPPPPPMYYPAPPPPSYYPAPSRPNRPSGPDDGPDDAGGRPGDELYPGDDEYSGYEPVEENNFKEEEWETVVQKCKVINVDDSTVIIKNCTSTDLDANPYAANREEGVEDSEASPREDDVIAGPMSAPYYAYNPYAYNYPPPPPPGPVYYAQPYPQYYAEQPPPIRRSRQPKDGVIRPYYYENYGEDDDESNKLYEEEDNFWRHDEEELVKKGFDRAV